MKTCSKTVARLTLLSRKGIGYVRTQVWEREGEGPGQVKKKKKKN